MQVYKCDRCGKVYVNIPKSKETIKLWLDGHMKNVNLNELNLYSYGYPMKGIDICQDCLDCFCEWFNEPIDYNMTDEDVYEY